MSISRGAGQSAAESVISGEISIFAAWSEDIYFFEPDTGAAMDLTGLDFEFQFRSTSMQTSADVTLSITGGHLSLELDSGSVRSILRITADAGTFSSYARDMFADLVAISGSGATHYGHGVVSFLNEPVAV